MANISTIVCLGLGLHPDGSMDPLLKERCKVAARLNKERGLPIINTGGDPRNVGISEAEAMADFMVNELGVDRNHIHLEEEAHNTSTNAKFSFKMLEKIQQQMGVFTRITILLVTNEYHMKRASFIFKSFFQEHGIRLDVEEHSAFDFGNTRLIIQEENKLTKLIHENMKKKISGFNAFMPQKLDLNMEKLITKMKHVF
eukprot:TRINITY_DN19512_c0_g1_i1.p1 TRINITY_DN19512_c0_g1~~TRINITY_DN19512_c0_g1_i1.p1  ORF type:complete len:199 (-),score=28.46 TRINITY_DN19512_c0_g1_i1:34-630(-)